MKKKNTIIIIGIVLLLVAITTTYILLSNKKIENVSKTSNQAELLTKKLNNSKELENTITTDKIVLSNINLAIETNTKVHLWIFSNPVDLGEVTIIKDESTYYINSINDTLKMKDIKAGNHKILILKDDKSLGYFNVELTAEKALKVTSTEMPDNTEEKNNENTSSNTQQNTQSSEQSKPEKVKCTPQKFEKRYTYFYTDEETCARNGAPDEVWQYFIKNNIPATNYGCEKIIDDCGNTYYGVYYGNTEGEKFYY